MKVRINVDYFNYVCENAVRNFKSLPEPLPWIEPSINMLYLNSISSYVFGNYFASILTISTLLEHVLRLALFDKENTGLSRDISIEQLDSMGTISQLIERARSEVLINADNYQWWIKVAKVIRNKSAHYILPTLLKEFTKEEYSQEDMVKANYHPEHYKLTKKDGTPRSFIHHDWGCFFHKSDYYLAKPFLNDATEKLKAVISQTNWKPDRSWWKSQEEEYNMFFSFKWDITKMINSLENMYQKL